MRKSLSYAGAVVVALTLSGCAAVAGGAAAGGVYEAQNKQQLEKLEAEFAAGEISREEYETRKEEIERGSVFY